VLEIDTLMGGYRGITAGYLIRSERPALIETGTARSTPTVVAALASLGIDAADLATVVVTHIHLDHAGGVGDIAEAYPGAEVVVHERGARHLADPSRLMASARMVFGDDMDSLFGPLRPVPAERLRAVGEREAIDLGGGRRLEAFHSPGHASTTWVCSTRSPATSTGDAAGVYVPRPPTCGRPRPPDFDLDCAGLRWTCSARRHPHACCSATTAGRDVDATLERSQEELRRWVDMVRTRTGRGALDHAVAMSPAAARASRTTTTTTPSSRSSRRSSTTANVQGIARWLDRQADPPEARAAARTSGGSLSARDGSPARLLVDLLLGATRAP
jgi:glyoxylase-like metal-dependent hydrolase (beta-lactamase superfamily II)